MISFKSTLINNVNIQRVQTNNVVKHKASIVELNLNSEQDYEIVRDIGLSWDNGKSFATDLFDLFAKLKFCKTEHNSLISKFYALSQNPNGVEDAKDILGVISLTLINNKTIFIPQLQVRPEQKYNSQSREFKHVGEALLRTIIQNYKDANFRVYPASKELEKFFKILNFKKDSNGLGMILKR